MQKSAAFLLCFLTLLTAYTQNKSVNAKTTIKKVTVFLSGAEVHRNGKLTILPGVNQLKLTGLSSCIKSSSVQASLTNDNLTILSVDHKNNYLTENTSTPRIAIIKDSLDNMALKYKIRESLERVYFEEKNMLLTNKSIGGRDTGVDIENLMEMADFYRKRLTEVETKLLDIEQEKADINKTIISLKAHLEQLNVVKTNFTSEIIIKVSSKLRITTDLDVSYIVTKAGWMPKYDIRAENTTDPIGLTYKADVFQNTGNDWDNVNLTLSTGDPSLNNTQPELAAWYLYFQNKYNVRDYKMPLIEREDEYYLDAIQVRGAREMATIACYSIKSLPLRASKSAANFTNYTENAVNAEFAIEIPYSILSNNEFSTVEIQQYDLPAKFEHYAAPKLDNDAFLLARITDWGEYNLLPGDVNVYFEGTSVGTSYLNTAIIDDTLAVSMGRDKGVVVKRDRIKDFCKTTGIGSNKKTIRGYKLSIKNNKSTTIELTLLDQMPISSNKQIEVNIVDYGEAKYNKENGELKWVLKLAPGESREINYRFAVKYPKNKIVGNL